MHSHKTPNQQVRTQHTSTNGRGTRDSDARVLHTLGQALLGRPTKFWLMTRQKKSEQDCGSPALRSSHPRSSPATSLPQTAMQAVGTGFTRPTTQSASQSHRTGTRRHQLEMRPVDSAHDSADDLSDTHATARQPGPQARVPNEPLRLKSRLRGDAGKALAKQQSTRPADAGPRPTHSLSPPSH